MKITNPDVAKVFQSYPKNIRTKLLQLRQLIFETAKEIEGLGELQETLKWGQPSYLPVKPGIGTTIRIDQIKNVKGQYAMYFHCQTTLVETFREIYPKELTYQGNRSIIFQDDEAIAVDQLRDCVSMALTYHLRKKFS